MSVARLNGLPRPRAAVSGDGFAIHGLLSFSTFRFETIWGGPPSTGVAALSLRSSPMPQINDGISGADNQFRRGFLDGGAVLPADGEDEGGDAEAGGEFAEEFAGEAGVDRDFLFLDLDAELLEVVAEEAVVLVNDLDQGGAGDAVGDLDGAGEDGEDDFVGAGLAEFGLGGRVLGAGEDAEVFADGAGGQGDEDVDHIIRQHGGQAHRGIHVDPQ